MTSDQIRQQLEARGYWLSIEGKTYNIFRGHSLEATGDKTLAIEIATECASCRGTGDSNDGQGCTLCGGTGKYPRTCERIERCAACLADGESYPRQDYDESEECPHGVSFGDDCEACGQTDDMGFPNPGSYS